MLLNIWASFLKIKGPLRMSRTTGALQMRFYSAETSLENKYTIEDKEKILQVMNEPDIQSLSGYNITKSRLKKFSSWKNSNGPVKSLTDIQSMEGFTPRTAKNLFDSILEGPRDPGTSNRIKGQVLDPPLAEERRKNCKTVLSIFIAVNSVSWTLIDRDSYEVTEWKYHKIDHKEGKKFKLTDILELSWKITSQLPLADLYVMKGEATTLRAAGSDPNNPKVIAVNLQKAQLVAMIVAFVSARRVEGIGDEENSEAGNGFRHRIHFLRPTLPYRLYGTLVGNEKVSTEQTVEMLLQSIPEEQVRSNNSKVYINERLKSMFRSQKDLPKDMMGHCLLLGITFMDVCVYRNQDSINRLLKRGE